MNPAAPFDADAGRHLLSDRSRSEAFRWTPGRIALSVFLFLAAGICEIGGGWFIWQAVRGRFRPTPPLPAWRSPTALASTAAGAVLLIGYGFLPTAQPPPTFGRLYAVYGGFFIILSYAWGWAVDRDRPDRGDCLGAVIALAGVALAWFWPR